MNWSLNVFLMSQVSRSVRVQQLHGLSPGDVLDEFARKWILIKKVVFSNEF